MQTQTVKAFRLGNSTVITLPKSTGIAPGTKVKIKKLARKIIIEPEKEDLAKKLALVKKIAGSGPPLSKMYKEVTGRDLTPEELNKIFESSYDSVLPRRKRTSLS